MGCISICRLLCIALLCALTISNIQVASENVPTESECRPHIEKALNIIKADTKEPEPNSAEVTADLDDSKERRDNADGVLDAVVTDDSNEDEITENSNNLTENDDSAESTNDADADEKSGEDTEVDAKSTADDAENDSTEADRSDEKHDDDDDDDNNDTKAEDDTSEENADDSTKNNENDTNEGETNGNSAVDDSEEQNDNKSEENVDNDDVKALKGDSNEDNNSAEANPANDDDDDNEDSGETESTNVSDERASTDNTNADDADGDDNDQDNDNDDDDDDDEENAGQDNSTENAVDTSTEDDEKTKNDAASNDGSEESDTDGDDNSEENSAESTINKREAEESNEITTKSYPVDDLLMESEIPENLRDRSHIAQILRLDDESMAKDEILLKTAENTLKDLKRTYENAIKPLETLYKYRDLSNRHFGDAEIFSKPLVLFMGPWSGGKSTILNYLTENEYTDFSLRTGAEPSPAYFNILMHSDVPQVLDGTQLAADWTFSGLQKFGQGLQDRLRGLKLPSKLLEKVNIVEIPGILEVRKQVSRIFPFNDACQWFIDRADIIFLVYDPSKLDVGPETEAILDQLKGREYQTRILLNKADQVHPEELLRVQSALIWNISPLMSSAQPPVMYTTSLWSHPYADNAPVRLLQAQEKALLQDLSQAIEHRIENKIASARRFAVRVRNHAKMVDCYLTTYYNHKTLFGNKNKISGEIVEHPQNYHIYEGLSTLTNISRYDLPDPEVYRDFFRLNPLYEFKKLSETCTYFRGCPINKLDVAIAYELPELVNRYKRAIAQALNTLELSNSVNDSSTDSR